MVNDLFAEWSGQIDVRNEHATNIVKNDPDFPDADDYEDNYMFESDFIPGKVTVALEVIKTQHNNQVTSAAFDVIYKYLTKEDLHV